MLSFLCPNIAWYEIYQLRGVGIFLLGRVSLMISAILAPFSVEIEVENQLTGFEKCQQL